MLDRRRTRRRRPNLRPALDGLESRVVLSTLLAQRPAVAALMQARVEAAQLQAQAQAPAKDDAKPKAVPPKIVRVRTELYGVLLPKRFVTGGKEPGAVIVNDGVVWELDLSPTKGMADYAKTLATKPVVAFGTGEIARDTTGKLKRKFKVNWVQKVDVSAIIPNAAFPDGNRPPLPPPPKPKV
jgi:hypothetical protein